MYLKQSRYKDGRTYLSIVHGYWDSQNKQSRTKTIKKIGYLDDMKKKYEDPVAHFTEMADAMGREHQAAKDITFTLGRDSQIERGAANRKNYGHIVFSKIYHELEIHRFLKNARRHEPFKFNTDALPISYKMFPGNTHDSETLIPVLAEVKKTFGVKRIITVADKGLNCGDNIAFNTILGDG